MRWRNCRPSCERKSSVLQLKILCYTGQSLREHSRSSQMVDVKIDATHAKQLAVAAAQGVAIALSIREDKRASIPPHIVCGIPPYIFEAALAADAAGNV